MQRSRGSVPDPRRYAVRDDGQPAAGPEKVIRVHTNVFRVGLTGSLYHYEYALQPPEADWPAHRKVMEEVWDQLSKAFTKDGKPVFGIQQGRRAASGGYLLAKKLLPETLVMQTPSKSHTVTVTFKQTFEPDQVARGVVGEAQLVFNRVVGRMFSANMQKLGRRSYNHTENLQQEGKGGSMAFKGFEAYLFAMPECAPLVCIDTYHRAVPMMRRNIIAFMTHLLDGLNLLAHPDSDITGMLQAEWKKTLKGAIVVTMYNNRLYRIKDVHFRMAPTDTFMLRTRDDKKTKSMSYVAFYQAYYTKEITEKHQPMLEAFAEKDTEKVFLVPELCMVTGINDEMRKDKTLMAEGLRHAMAQPTDRYQEIVAAAKTTADARAAKTNLQAKAMKAADWEVQVDPEPLVVNARVADPLEVSFGQKRYLIEDGNFQRWMRNGLHEPGKLDDWIFIYPESDTPVLDIWLRSLKDIAQVAFTMRMSEPTRVICTDQRREIVRIVEENVTPKTQLVLLLTPHRDCKRVYELFKKTTCGRYPVPTQVVKSETIRKRQSIAAVLSRIVLQINAKSCGPLWRIELQSAITHPLMTNPTMIVGIDVVENADGQLTLGFAASLDRDSTDYYSSAVPLHKAPGSGPDYHRPLIAMHLQEFLREAIRNFVMLSDSLPMHIIVYRASVDKEHYAAVFHDEIRAFDKVVAQISTQGAPYRPQLTVVGIGKKRFVRFFLPSQDKTFLNPQAGTIIDAPELRMGRKSWFLVNQSVGKGSAVPTQYVVLFDGLLNPLDPSGGNPVPCNALQNLTYRLSYLYYNYTGSIRLPAHAQYAQKIAQLIGSTVGQKPADRLCRTLFHL